MLPKGARNGLIKHVFVGPTGKRVGQGLEYYLDEDQIRAMFSKYGEVTDIQLRSNAKDVFAFVHFIDSYAAARAITDLKGWRIKEGVRTKVSWGSYNAGRDNMNNNNNNSNNNNSNNNNRQNQQNQQQMNRGRRQNQHHDPNVPNHVSYPNQQQRQMNLRNPSNNHTPDDSPRRRTNNAYATTNQYSRSRSRSEERKDASFRLTIENLPPQMKREDLREIGRHYGGHDSVRSSKVWIYQNCTIGRLEFYTNNAQLTTYGSLKGHRINGLKIRLYCD